MPPPDLDTNWVLKKALLPIIILSLVSGLTGASFTLGSPPIGSSDDASPAPSLVPLRPLVDHPGVLQSDFRLAIEKLLTEHQRMTGENIVIAVYRSGGDADLTEKTQELFRAWDLDSRTIRAKSVLLVLFWKERQARMEIGYGMDAVLSEDQARDLVSDYLIADLKASGPNRALSLVLFQLLRTLESPLVHNGEAQATLQAAGFTGPWEPQSKNSAWLWALGVMGLLASAALVVLVLIRQGKKTNHSLHPAESPAPEDETGD